MEMRKIFNGGLLASLCVTGCQMSSSRGWKLPVRNVDEGFLAF